MAPTPRPRTSVTSSSAPEKQAGLRRSSRRTKAGLLRIDRAAAAREAHYDGKWLLRTSHLTLTAEDLAAAYKQLLAVERGWRDCKSSLRLRPVYHHREDRIRYDLHQRRCGHTAFIGVARNPHLLHLAHLRHELDRMHLGHLRHRRRPRRATLRPDRQPENHPRRADLPEPPKYIDITPVIDAAVAYLTNPPGSRCRARTRPKSAHPTFTLVNTKIGDPPGRTHPGSQARNTLVNNDFR